MRWIAHMADMGEKREDEMDSAYGRYGGTEREDEMDRAYGRYGGKERG